jgi:hypothetical protein
MVTVTGCPAVTEVGSILARMNGSAITDLADNSKRQITTKVKMRWIFGVME